jgi:hypothetical protein
MKEYFMGTTEERASGFMGVDAVHRNGLRKMVDWDVVACIDHKVSITSIPTKADNLNSKEQHSAHA